jgi:hypothetical protein
MRRIVVFAAVAALVVSTTLAPTVSAGAPTEIGVYPNGTPSEAGNYFWQCASSSFTPRAYWTVGLDGGSSGSFTVSVNYGDGTSNTSSHAAVNNGAQYDTHHDFKCNRGYFYQNWRASRGGGGSAYQTTQVWTLS